MQFNIKDYDERLHDLFNALTVKQPYASGLATGEKTIEVRSKNTKYRGEILVCSSKNPVIDGLESGVTVGLVELYDVKAVKDFTEQDWEQTRIPEEKRKDIKGGYGWMMRKARRVLEFPVTGQLGIYRLAYTKGEIIPYPENVILERKDY